MGYNWGSRNIVNSSGQKDGVTVTLTRLTITRISMQVSLQMRGAAQNTGQVAMAMQTLRAELAVPDALRRISGPTITISQNGRRFYFGWLFQQFVRSGYRSYRGGFGAQFYSYHGKATLVVYTHLVEKPSGPGYSITFTQPITLHFTVP